MKKILILGAGLVAKPIIEYLLSKGFFITIASNTPDRATEIIGNHSNGRSVYWEATDEPGLDELISAHDLTVSLLPYVFHFLVAKHCIKHRRNMVTTSYVKPEMRALDQDAKDAGIIILNEIGLDPGIDHMSAMRIIDKIHDNNGAVLEFYSICGALPAPESAGNPFRYKFSWSPKGVIMAGNNDAAYLHHGRKVNIPTEDLFKNPFQVDFPGVGLLDVYPNRDSLAYIDIYDIPEAQTMYRGTFRYKGWCEILDAMKKLGLISYDKFDMTGMTYAEMVGKGLSQSGLTDPAEVENKVSEYLAIPTDSVPMQAMKWLGLFERTVMNRGIESTFEVTSDLMISKMTLGHEEKDMVVMQHTFLAGYADGHREVIRSRMLDFGSPSTDTSVARTVALPAAVAVEMILNGKINLHGVHIPVIQEIYHPVLDQLEAMGIKMDEKYGLPLTENIS